MCVYSMIADHHFDKWNKWPYKPMPWDETIIPSPPNIVPGDPYIPSPTKPLTDEEIEDFRRLLERAKKYDEETGQKDCELESKKEKLKKLVEELGKNLDWL